VLHRTVGGCAVFPACRPPPHPTRSGRHGPLGAVAGGAVWVIGPVVGAAHTVAGRPHPRPRGHPLWWPRPAGRWSSVVVSHPCVAREEVRGIGRVWHTAAGGGPLGLGPPATTVTAAAARRAHTALPRWLWYAHSRRVAPFWPQRASAGAPWGPAAPTAARLPRR